MKNCKEKKGMKIVNDLCFKMSPQLIKNIYREAYRLEATSVKINKAKWNQADVTMFEDDDCIEWHIKIYG